MIHEEHTTVGHVVDIQEGNDDFLKWND